MNKKRLWIRLIVSPLIFGLLVVTYTIGCVKHFIGFLRWGGEWNTYRKGDDKTIGMIYDYLKETKPLEGEVLEVLKKTSKRMVKDKPTTLKKWSKKN